MILREIEWLFAKAEEGINDTSKPICEMGWKGKSIAIETNANTFVEQVENGVKVLVSVQKKERTDINQDH